jgi:hypothetical protein
MRSLLIIPLLLLASCKMSSFYPVIGATGGATVGSLGGPVGSGGGALVGYSVGKGAQLMDQNKDLQETVQALSEGDVETIAKKALERGMESQEGKFQEFIGTVKTFLYIAAIALVLYLGIPIFVAKRCARKEAERHQTRVPFPTRTTGTRDPEK